MNEERWCSMREVCEYLGTSDDTVTIWIKTRNFPGVKVGGLWKFKQSEIEQWIASADSVGTRFRNKQNRTMPSLTHSAQRKAPVVGEKAISYKPLFKLLIDKEMKKKELAEKANISMATITKMGKLGSHVNTDVLERICHALDCKIGDILEIVEISDISTIEEDLADEPVVLDLEACEQYGLNETEKDIVHYIYEQLQYYRDNPPAFMVHQARVEFGLKTNEEAQNSIPTDRFYSLVLNDVIDIWGQEGAGIMQKGISFSLIESGCFEVKEETSYEMVMA